MGLIAREEPQLVTFQTFFHWGKSDHVGLYRTMVQGPPRIDKLEIAEASFFALDDLPDSLHSSTKVQLRAFFEASPELAPR